VYLRKENTASSNIIPSNPFNDESDDEIDSPTEDTIPLSFKTTSKKLVSRAIKTHYLDASRKRLTTFSDMSHDNILIVSESVPTPTSKRFRSQNDQILHEPMSDTLVSSPPLSPITPPRTYNGNSNLKPNSIDRMASITAKFAAFTSPYTSNNRISPQYPFNKHSFTQPPREIIKNLY
jgi:hypothetical protein